MGRQGDKLTAEEAQQDGVMESVLQAPAIGVPVANLPADVVAELICVGLLVEEGGMVKPTPAALHFAKLINP
ncbi:MAG TPA: hypothetical protein VJL81_03825 [Solirubrobacterales bacterium]|nr:hypothetical protein [Solirubrobacterales bacterium]